MDYKGKELLQTTLEKGNIFRQEYLDSINKFISKKFEESKSKRDAFMGNNVRENQEKNRQYFLDLIGCPVNPYPTDIPNAKRTLIGQDQTCTAYYMQIEVMPDFWSYGIHLVPHNAKKTPLVILQHGGWGLPEVCCDLLGKNDYAFAARRMLEKGMSIFAPQTLLWLRDTKESANKKFVNIPFERGVLDDQLKHLGYSMMGVEIFCIRRAIDYLSSLDYIDEDKIGMTGLSYGGYFSLHTAALETRIKAVYSCAVFNDRTKQGFSDMTFRNSANTMIDAEVASLIAPRTLLIDVGKSDPVFKYEYAVAEAERAKKYYEMFGAGDKFRFNLWEGGHLYDEQSDGFEVFANAILK
jgi:dienelactone hydrolase